MTIPTVVVKQLLKIISLLICHCLVSIVNIVLGICQSVLAIVRDTNLKTLSHDFNSCSSNTKVLPIFLMLLFCWLSTITFQYWAICATTFKLNSAKCAHVNICSRYVCTQSTDLKKRQDPGSIISFFKPRILRCSSPWHHFAVRPQFAKVLISHRWLG